jgi:hypothetical protein
MTTTTTMMTMKTANFINCTKTKVANENEEQERRK